MQPARPPSGADAAAPAHALGRRAPVKAAVLGLVLVAAGCRRCKDPELVPYETPAEAVYRVAVELGARGELEARRMALDHIVARYPNSRFAVMARDDLKAMGPPDAAANTAR